MRSPTQKPEPKVVRSREAKVMLGHIGNDRLYELIRTRKLDSYVEGSRRYVTVASIDRHIAEQLAAAQSQT